MRVEGEGEEKEVKGDKGRRVEETIEGDGKRGEK